MELRKDGQRHKWAQNVCRMVIGKRFVPRILVVLVYSAVQLPSVCHSHTRGPSQRSLPPCLVITWWAWRIPPICHCLASAELTLPSGQLGGVCHTGEKRPRQGTVGGGVLKKDGQGLEREGDRACEWKAEGMMCPGWCHTGVRPDLRAPGRAASCLWGGIGLMFECHKGEVSHDGLQVAYDAC